MAYKEHNDYMSCDIFPCSSHNKNKKGLLSITVGLLLIAAALVLVLYNLWDAKRAEKVSGEIVEKLEAIIPDKNPNLHGYDNSNKEMPTIEIDGYLYIGILDIPSLGLRLPVMADWDYKRLKISPCRYSGTYYSDDMVICAHNYARHFSSIRWADIGEDVYFTTVDGWVYHYQISNRETIQAAAAKDMIDHTKEDWDMTLFTCNTSGQTRCAIRLLKN